MRVPPRLLAVVSFVVVGMLALVVAGLVDWIVGVLFLAMEFLGELLRNVYRHPRVHRHPPAQSRHDSYVTQHVPDGHRGLVRRGGRPRRRQAGHREGDATPPMPSDQRLRILVFVGGDEPDLLDFALKECRRRRAEMILLFLRALAVTPMGPSPLPGLSEDDEARATFDRLGSEADRVGVPLRTIYATTSDLPATIGEVARDCEADVVLVGATPEGSILKVPGAGPDPVSPEAAPRTRQPDDPRIVTSH